jgi:2-aminoethylphosphonate-pyruvate transaminase
VTKTAVILAAGRGIRLEELGTQIPKGFIRLGAVPIIEESIARLRDAGIDRLVIVTGHLDGYYRDLAARIGGRIELVHSTRFADSGSMYSLWLARDAVRGEPFILAESDLIYEARALASIMVSRSPDVLLVSGPTGSGDEVYVEADGERLVNLSKRRDDIGQVYGELVGLSRVSPQLFQAMCAAAEERFGETLRMEYEQALVVAARTVRVECLLVPDLVWAEIDDAQHLERAARQVYPRIPAL